VRPAFSAGAALDTLKETPTRCASPAKRVTVAVTWSANVINNSNKAHRHASLSTWKTAGDFQSQPYLHIDSKILRQYNLNRLAVLGHNHAIN
jgi:hypothetical protein